MRWTCRAFLKREMSEKEPILSEQDVVKAYKRALRTVSIVRGSIPDETRQAMADAVHEFYHLLEDQIEAKRSRRLVRERTARVS